MEDLGEAVSMADMGFQHSRAVQGIVAPIVEAGVLSTKVKQIIFWQTSEGVLH